MIIITASLIIQMLLTVQFGIINMGSGGKRKGAGVFADSLLLIEKPTGWWARLLHAVEVLLEDLPRLQARALALQIIDDRLLVGVLGGTYGKYMNRDIDSTVIMEYESFLPFLLPYLPVYNAQLNNYINSNPTLLE
mgnify:CR=1 FL=1